MKQIKQILEALLFSVNEPVGIKKLLAVVQSVEPLQKQDLQKILNEMREEYLESDGCFQLDEIAEGYQLRTKMEYSSYVEMLHRNVKKERLSHAGSEVLSIVAFKQPVTRAQIDEIRGVDSSGILHTLQERELVENVGKLDVPGRPSLYGTTKKFLIHFGLRDLDELIEGTKKATEESSRLVTDESLSSSAATAAATAAAAFTS